jgi:DNA-binding beta-propeller fold protein YncE
MTIVNTLTNRIVKTVQRQEGGGFNMSSMMGSMGGFMQLAVAPSGQDVYAASFSGNVMVYNAATNSFAKDIPVGMMAKLSGLAIDPSGKYAYVTVENEKKTVSISLKTDRVVSSQSGLISNRWYVTQ